MPVVLHIISGLKVGGAENVLLRLIVSSRNGPYSHKVVSLTPDGAMLQRFLDAEVDVTVLDFKRSPVSEFLRLVRILGSLRPDIVQTWMYHADLIGGVAARLTNNRNIIWGIRTTDLTAGGSRATAFIRKLCARLSSVVPNTIVCAAEASRRAHVSVGYDPGRMAVVPNGFLLEKLFSTDEQRTTLRNQCGFKPSEMVIGTLGRFHGAKDYENFVRATGVVAKKFSQVRFLLVGRGLDTGNNELMRWIAQTGHTDRFVLLGERNDVSVCLSAMDIFCLSSRTEGFPNVVGEAMAMGVPCVVTNVGDAAMLVAETGIVVPKEDSTSLAQGMERVLTMSSTQRQQLGQQAKARIYGEFTMARCCDRFEAIYKKVAEEGKH